jgi:sec-independent protein translocase protein TatA
MFAPAPIEILIVLIVVLLLFGRRLPSVMNSLGRSLVEFKKGVKGIDQDATDESRDTAPEKSRTT